MQLVYACDIAFENSRAGFDTSALSLSVCWRPPVLVGHPFRVTLDCIFLQTQTVILQTQTITYSRFDNKKCYSRDAVKLARTHLHISSAMCGSEMNLEGILLLSLV